MLEKDVNRRSLIKGAAVLGASTYLASRNTHGATAKGSVIVVGAGAFGGWSALQLLRQGMRVTLVDMWGPGNSRATSGGESRALQATYSMPFYSRMAIRSRQLWQSYGEEFGVQLFNPTGTLWLAGDNDSYEQKSAKMLGEFGEKFERLTPEQCAQRWPQISFEGVNWGLLEPDGGLLNARLACEEVFRAFLKEGGEFIQAQALPGSIKSSSMDGLQVSSGKTLSADKYVFACGPWLGKTLPILDSLISTTRQEVFFFGTSPGDLRFSDSQLPVWMDNATHQINGTEYIYYGFPSANGRGFKIANDARGPVIDPTSVDRQMVPGQLAAAREYMRLRFPDLADAPLIDSRVCQYESTPRGRFIIDKHPEADNVWIAGGGSGHGFKHGPVLGEIVAGAVLDRTAPPAEMSVADALKSLKA